MTRNFAHYSYQKSKTSQYSYNYNINIQPAFCNQILGGHTFGSSDSDCINISDRISVYYQMGSSFSFIVPKSFIINSIIFDALDSSLLPTERWLRENSRWCTLNVNKTLSINTLNPNPPDSCDISTIQTEQWKTTYGFSLFKFGYSDKLSNINGVGTLTITNWVFQNFFYSFNSFIGLSNGYGMVSIIGCIFDRFSNWGSIIRDTDEYPNNLNYNKAGLNLSISTTFRDTMFTSDLIQNKVNMLSMFPWENNTWASIKIESSTFQNFNYMKLGGQTYHQVSDNSNMRFQGIILNLSDFFGTISLSNNQFQLLRFSYNNCEEIYNTPSDPDASDIWGSPSILQAKTLIYIKIRTSEVEIYGNTFNNWNSLLGIIYLQRSSTYITPILIHNNVFSRNSAIIGANVIKLYMYTGVSYSTIFELNNMIWAGVQISNNNFQHNIGWFNTIGALQAVCYLDGDDPDPSAQTNHYTSPTLMSKTNYENRSKQGIISFSTVNIISLPSSSIPIDLNKFLMTNNTFDENFAGFKAGVVELINIRKIHIISDSFVNNGGIYKEAMDLYGSITSSGDTSSADRLPGAFILFAYFGETGNALTLKENSFDSNLQNYYPVAPLIIDGSFYISISGLKFDSNAMPELTQSLVTSFYPSNAITLRRSQGNLYLNSVTIQNYKGFDLSKLQLIFDSVAFSNIYTANPTERLSDSSAINKVYYPSFILDYGFKNRLIRLAKPSANTDSDFQNYFDVVELNNFNLYNLTQYDPLTTMASVIDMSDDCVDVSVKNFTIKDVDIIKGTTGMLVFRNYGSLQLSDGTVQNINLNTYFFDSANCSYLGTNGGVFVFNSAEYILNYGYLTYSISNITIDKVYSKAGGAFYFGSDNGIDDFQITTINMTSISITNSLSYSEGIISFHSGYQYVYLSNSLFSSNIGILCEADMIINLIL